ncbi:MAG: hypothetical protein A7316_05495 [Candidatus Altiarchaeales archaeon WOR_SM1_86-2]|nr:MAG: hypothetical protein A7316_05495 [Candidatus Altiarchaeales archaeon WOR_SM1_86-2]
MAELVVNIPEELAHEIKGMHVNWQDVALEAVKSRAFELKLEKSRKLRHLLFKVLISKSKLTEEDAMELGKDINESMLKDLKNKGLI